MQKTKLIILVVIGVLLVGGIYYYKAESGKMCQEFAGKIPAKQCAPGFRCTTLRPDKPYSSGQCRLVLFPKPEPAGDIIIFNSPAPSSGPQPKAGEECIVGGCNGELCLDKKISEDISSVCVYLPKFACYKSATCEKQANGECGWIQTKELETCLKNSPEN